jgi:eukaryotic-like serine/threonine-protein kinase
MEVIETIARGGFGVVEKVRLPDDTVVARKTFDPSIQDTTPRAREKLLDRFRREVKIQSLLKAESICPILDSDLKADPPWFTMPLAKQNLAQAIRVGKTNDTIPVQALADVLNALEAMHELGYVHRDLKPQNVLLIGDLWKLADFGLVSLPPDAGTRITSIGSAWGSWNYAAPEQVTEFGDVEPSADIYSFGCVLHDIYGEPRRTPYARHTAEGPIGAVIERCTEQSPDKRFVSVPALRGTLFSVLSTPPDLNPSTSVSEWVSALERRDSSGFSQFDALVRFLNLEPRSDARQMIFRAIDEQTLQWLNGLEKTLWKRLALDYCQWVGASAFDYGYCDVLARRLRVVLDLGDLETKAAAAISAAKLGREHNRWYVMEKVLRMCGPEMEYAAAQRLGIEIRAFELEAIFRHCADVISCSYADYHVLIKEAIDTED